ncbi:hypothetical protein Vretimale_13771 [Volvox reticuliferus]|uniref:Cytochrome b561 domain-containing protein n=1 Tax=Volvox reticuliferus TaxID=1737510 RepID=A0A8J4CQE0_9CHLO|nr:hypothetical protein Vretifemale_14613 [Volvox reticuliferus]GIM09983.1 hypothetical protein Vretimale_13771 [Volvox reticuliferus]
MPQQLHNLIIFCMFNVYILNPAIGQSLLSLHSQDSGAIKQAHPRSLLNRQLQTSLGEPCARSWLGYQCTQLVCGRIRIHWSLGGDPPSGDGCAYQQNGNTTGAQPSASAQLLHMALQTDLTQYVALSWPGTTGRMAPADAIIGFLVSSTGNYSIGAFKITGESASKVQLDEAVTITNKRVEANNTALTICFTRNITQVGQGAGVNISVQDSVGMNFVASRSEFGKLHSLNPDYKCGVDVNFVRPVGGPDDGLWRPSNVSSDPSDDVLAERLFYMRTHGALQFTGWIALVPIGILAARHRWIFAPASITGLWFQIHRAVQMIAVVLIIAGFVLPWTSFDSNDEQQIIGVDHETRMSSDPLLSSHEALAIMLMVVLGLHIIVAIVRPKPDAPRRRVWNMVHWWTGRSLALIAVVNVLIGITLWRRVSGGNGIEWIIPLVVLATGWLGLAIWLEFRAPTGLGREGSYAPPAGDGSALLASSPSPSEVPSPKGGVPLLKLSGGQTSIVANKA